MDSGGNMNNILRAGNDVWRRQTYMGPEYRKDLMNSSNRQVHNE